MVNDGVGARLVEMVGALRSKGLPCGTSETVDAGRVMEVLGLDDRERLREGLAAALVRRGGQRDVFDAVFDLYFPAGVGARAASRHHEDPDDDPTARTRPTGEAPDRLGVDELRELLARALAEQDRQTLAELAERAVDALGRVGSGGAGTLSWSALQTMERLRPQTLVAAAVAARLAAGRGGGGEGGDHGGAGGDGSGGGQGAGAGGSGGDGGRGSPVAEEASYETEFTDRLVRDEVRRDLERLRQLVASAARRRAAETRGRDRMTRYAVPDSAERTDFLAANLQQFAALRGAVRPLSRKLATRLAAKRRRARRGVIDVRRTMRSSMSTGGVPVRPVYRRPRPSRPELVLLCDVSGSVAGFSGFTMLLVRALADQFSRVRVFAFVNAMDEVTDLVQQGRPDLTTAILREARVTTWHGSSDYGEALGDFAELYLDVVGPRTSVLVLGDGRNNFGDANLVALQRIRDQSRRTFWLNPESRGRWGSGDSCADDYATVVDMHECRTIEQLSTFITRLLPV